MSAARKKSSPKRPMLSGPIPNPGSDEAIKLGCKCPVSDNYHGKGLDTKGTKFWIEAGCPLHGGMFRSNKKKKK